MCEGVTTCDDCGPYKHFCPVYTEHHNEITFEEDTNEGDTHA